MGNSIKYTAGTELNSLASGNFKIGTGDVPKGPTSVTGYYRATTPPSGGYRIYVFNDNLSGDIGYYTAVDNNDLIAFTNRTFSQSFTTAAECLVYYAGQSNRVVFNREYESIATSGLTYSFDFGFSPGYPTSGTTFYDLRSTNNGTLFNEPSYSSNNGGVMTFDGSNDYGTIPNSSAFDFGTGPFTIEIWSKITNGSSPGPRAIIEKNNGGFGPGGFQFQTISNIYTWRLGSSSGTQIFQNFLNQSDGGWIYNAITTSGFSGGSYDAKVYWGQSSLNDTNSLTFSLTYADNSGEINVGRRGNNSSYMAGDLGIFRTYNRQLSDNEITSNFNAQKGRFGF
jgi:hypothetical protein